MRNVISMEGKRDLGDDDLPASPAAEEIGGNEDLMREIFLRLPVRLLITFKSVSKHWSSLISDPLFARRHTLLRNPSTVMPTGVFFYDSITRSTEIEYVSLEYVPEQSYRATAVRVPPFSFVHTASGAIIKIPIESCRATRFRVPSISFFDAASSGGAIDFVQSIENVSDHSSSATRVRAPSLSFLDVAASGATIKILQSMSGLMLCRFTSQLSDSEVKHEYCVCNPTTKKYTIIPQPTLMEPEKVVDFILAFEPSESPYYKIICVKSLTHRYHCSDDLGLCQIDIYSSENRIWRSTSCRFNGSECIQSDKTAVYWNGIIHFVTNNLLGYNSVEFDIKEEIFKGPNSMHHMPHDYPNTPLRYLGECRGHLHALYVRTPSSKLIRVLERDKETLRWITKYRLHLNRILPSFPEIIFQNGQWAQSNFGVEYAFSVLYIYKGEREVDSAMVLTIPGKVISYNFHYKTVKVLRELPARDIDTSLHKYVTGFHFIETLAVA